MLTSSQFIDEIIDEIRHIEHLSQQLSERYNALRALLAGAQSMVPQERWESWLKGNLGWDAETATSLIYNQNNHGLPQLPLIDRNDKHEKTYQSQEKQSTSSKRSTTSKRSNR